MRIMINQNINKIKTFFSKVPLLFLIIVLIVSWGSYRILHLSRAIQKRGYNVVEDLFPQMKILAAPGTWETCYVNTCTTNTCAADSCTTDICFIDKSGEGLCYEDTCSVDSCSTNTCSANTCGYDSCAWICN